MGKAAAEGWSNLPKELLLRVFFLAAGDAPEYFYPLSQVCKQWRKVVIMDMLPDYEAYINDLKIGLKLKTPVFRPIALKNLFTCFHLAEYDKDFLFWPKQSTSNMLYCSEIKGNHQVIAYDISATSIDYIRLTDSEYVEHPTDHQGFVYQEYTDVSPFSGADIRHLDLIKNNSYPTFKKGAFTLCVYEITDTATESVASGYRSNPIKYHLCTSKKASYASLSQNGRFMVVAFSGLISVYHLPAPDSEGSVDLTDLRPVFSKQQPSIVKFASVDNDGQVLFIKSLRLGGLCMVSLVTGEEIEFPHYRLELNMSSQLTDHIIMLNGYQETIVYGLPFRGSAPIVNSVSSYTSKQPSEKNKNVEAGESYMESFKKLKILPVQRPLFDYFEFLVNASMETVVEMNNVLPIDPPGCFIGLVKGHYFPSRSEAGFSVRNTDRSIDLVLLVDRDFPANRKDLSGKYLEDFQDQGDHYEAVSQGLNELNGCSRQSTNSSEIDESTALDSSFKVIPLLYNIHHMTRSQLMAISDDGTRFALMFNNLLYILNVSAQSVWLMLDRFNRGELEPLDLFTAYSILTDPADFRMEIAVQTNHNISHIRSHALNHHHLVQIDELFKLPEFKEHYKRFNSINSVMDSDDDEDDEDFYAEDAESLSQRDALFHPSVASPINDRLIAHILERKPQLVWLGNEKLAVNFAGSLTIIITLKDLI